MNPWIIAIGVFFMCLGTFPMMFFMFKVMKNKYCELAPEVLLSLAFGCALIVLGVLI